MTIHDDIDNYLAADLHDQLSEAERNALHTHLVECATCRKTHQETKTMNKVLEERFTAEKPDGAFEQRLLRGFRDRVPQKERNIFQLIVDLMRLRSAQIAGVAALLLALVQVGRMVTGEGAHQESRLVSVPTAQVVGSLERDELAAPADLASGGALTAQISPTRNLELSKDKKVDGPKGEVSVTLAAPPSPSAEVQPEFHEGAKAPALAQSEAYSIAERPFVGKGNPAASGEAAPSPALANRKLIRNATIDLEIASFEDAVVKISGFADQERGYVATSGSEKQANGKLKGQVVVKVLPENLDRFLQKIRAIGELKNQTIGTEDVTKRYFDTEARLKNAQVMEQRLIDMLKTKTGKVSDLLQVEKELGRVREEIEKMQGELKYWDSQVQFATVTISLSEKDMEQPAAFLVKEHAQLALYSPEVEKVYNQIKALASPQIQITNAQLNRDNTGRVSARVSILIEPEESESVIGKVKGFGRVENFQTQTERIAQGGNGMSQNAKTKRDKVDLNITLSRDEQEQALQQTSLRIRTAAVDEKTKALRDLAEKQSGRVMSSSFNRDPDGREFANVSLRVPMKNYSAFMQSLTSLGKPENVSVQRQERPGVKIDGANAPADVSIQVYSQGNLVSQESGLFATLRRTIGQSAAAIMWSLRMIGVAIAFLAPWVVALAAVIWMTRRLLRARR
jgi:Domain of unknown function (DUF4349)